jgi:hypothetical protein
VHSFFGCPPASSIPVNVGHSSIGAYRDAPKCALQGAGSGAHFDALKLPDRHATTGVDFARPSCGTGLYLRLGAARPGNNKPRSMFQLVTAAMVSGAVLGLLIAQLLRLAMATTGPNTSLSFAIFADVTAAGPGATALGERP